MPAWIERTVSGVAVLVFLAVIGYMVARLLAGCAPRAEGPTLPRYCTEESLYTAALLRCVDKANTLAESQMCRQQVDYTCGIRQTVKK